MSCFSQRSQMPAGHYPRWISAATRLIGPFQTSDGATRPDLCAVSRSVSPLAPRKWLQEPQSLMKIETVSVDFTDEQKRYLEGFTTGLQISRVGKGLGGGGGGGASAKANAEPTGPEAPHIRAQDRTIAAGKKLVDQEKWKREEHPFDAYVRLKEQALIDAR